MMKFFLLLLLCPLMALATDLPKGFNGMPWGAPLANLPNAQKIAESKLFQCHRSGDGSATVANTIVSNVRLCFAGDRFYFAQMEFTGRLAYEQLLAHGKSGWGEPKPGQRFTDAFVWGGPEQGVYVELEFSKIDDRGTLVYVYLPVYKETQEASKPDRSKLRPGSGF
jgi:hypothetical protein